MASTGDKVVSTQIIDHVDGQPSIVLSNGNWGVFDPKTNMYKDTGIKASPEDDSSAVKYYILNNVTTPPEAPSQTGGWNTLASLNAALLQAGWDEDPLQTTSTNRYCWIATYGKENIVDTVATEAEGHLVFKPKFTRTNVRLWSNYANSPTISVVGNEIIITNPDGTVVKQKFASTEAVNDLSTLIASLQSQVDGAIYSYSMEGVPSLNTQPTTDWRLDSSGNPITDPATIADVYRTHVGDTYTDTLTYFSYRFSQTGASSSNPAHYEWKIIENDALTAALGEIAQLGREKITVFTEQPNSPYKKGDMWLDGEVMLHAIQSSEVFNQAHWVQPYATKVEVDAIETALQSAAADATLANQNLEALETNLTNMTGTVADAIKDNIISDTELMDLNAELKQLDIDQESLLTTVNYLLNSIYLPATPKATLQTRSNASIAAGGSMDIYQAQISSMIADGVISAQERTNYTSKFNTYKNDLKLLNEAISGASSAIEGELKRLADEKVDNIEIGGRNLILNSLNRLVFLANNPASQPIQNELVSGENYQRFRRTYPEGITDTGIGTYRPQTFTPEKSGYYTYSVYFRPNEFDVELRLHFGISASAYGNFILCKANEWTQVSVTKWVEAGVATRLNGVYGVMPPEAVQWIDYNRVSVTSGNKATDWTPAPEDVQAEIDDVSTGLTDLGAEIDTAFSNLSITNIEANNLDLLRKSLAKEVADVRAIAVSMSVSVVDLDSKISALNTEVNKYAGKADSVYPITVTVANRTAIETTFSNLEASIVALYEAIDKKRVDDIEIGGRNLVQGGDYIWDNAPIDEPVGSYEQSIVKRNINVEPDTTYTLNYVKGDTSPELRIYQFTDEPTHVSHNGYYSLPERIAEVTISSLPITFKTPSNCTNISLTTGSVRSIDGKFEYKKIKLEKGTKATDWTPAPEDVQAEIDAAVIKATYWSIKASTPVIYKDSNSATASGVHTPITVNGELRSGTTTTPGGFISIQPNGGAESTATASPRTIAPTDAEGKTNYTVRLYEKADKATLLDTMTIPVVFKGASGINVAMSNEADVLPASPTGEVSDYADTGNVIRVFEGANELAFTKPTTAIVKGESVDISTKNVTNLLQNSSFENGVIEPLQRTDGSGSGSTLSINTINPISGNYDAGLEVTTPATSENRPILRLNGFQNEWVINHVFYFGMSVKINSGTPVIQSTTNGAGQHFLYLTLKDGFNSWAVKCDGLSTDFGLIYLDGTTLWDFNFDNLISVDLTETFGAGNEPTEEECDKIFGGYFEGTAPLSDVALGGNGTYQVQAYPSGITEGEKSASGLACSFANASNMTTDSAKITFHIYGLSSSGTPFDFSKTQNFSKSKIGADGEGGINVMITRQGSFRTYWRQIGDQGQILTVPEKVSEIIGGVEIEGVEYIQCKVIIYKGSVDVTASALADPTTMGKWYLNNELMGSVTDTLNIPITHADGVDDEVRFEYTDTNAKNW